jgi:hypothetical protein
MVCLEWDFDCGGYCDGVDIVHTGFIIYYGKVSEQYDVDVEVGPDDREVCLTNSDYFVEGMDYYFVATATGDVYGTPEESDYSNEVVWSP